MSWHLGWVVAGFLALDVWRLRRRRWLLDHRSRWKCPDCELLMITEDRETLDLVRNIHHDQTGHGIGVTPH